MLLMVMLAMALQPAGMGRGIGIEKGIPVVMREQADLENDIEMLSRDRRRVGRAGDLRG